MYRNFKPIGRKLKSTEGAEIAEAALVLPLLFMLLLGIIWFGRVFNIYSTIAQAAQQGAITAARSTCASCSTTGGWNGTNFPSDGTVDTVIDNALNASSIDPSQIPVNSNPPAPAACGSSTLSPPLTLPLACTNTNNITICRNALLKPATSASQPPECGVVVSFQYPFQFFLPFTPLNMQKIVLSVQAQSRMEY
jgi:Flp pilus assembly protein TadG